jgi:tetratricopeptide (TPR) repeat protein
MTLTKPVTYVAWLAAALASVACARNPEAEVRSSLEAAEQARRPERALARARAFASVGDLMRAEQYLKLALDAGADSSEVTPLLVEVCTRDQRFLDAIQHIEHHLRHHPDDARLRYVLASLEAAVGNQERARAEYERVLAREPNNAEVHYALAVLLRDGVANLEQADSHFRAYLRLRPGGNHAEESRAALLTELP